MSEPKKREAVFVISVAAELAGIHPQTLRIWERRGLVEPYRTPGGTRRYSQADIDRLELIQSLSEKGLNLEGVKRVLDLQRSVERLKAENHALKRQLMAEREAHERELAHARQSHRREIVLRRSIPPDRRR
jgi:MerR family transcriptional regulator/heat shock protein HspR